MNVIKRFNIYAGLPHSIYILFMVRIINSMGNFVYPFLTFFLIERLGLSGQEAGLYFLFAAFSQGIGSIIGGKLTDSFGRKNLMIVFQGLSGICFVPSVFIGNSMWIPRLLILSGMFAGAAQSVNSAMVNDLTNKENRKQAFSLLYLGVNIGFAIGPTIAGFLYYNHTNWIFIGNASSIFISIILLFIFVKETMPEIVAVDEENNTDASEAAEEGGVIKVLLKRPILIFFMLGRTINQFVYSTIGFALPIQLISTFGSEVGPKNFGYLMSFTGVVIILFTVPITKLTMGYRPLINIALAGFFYAIGFGMIRFIDIFILYLVSALIFTLGEILEATNSGVYIANHSPITHRGRFNAIIPFVYGLGNALGPYAFGKLIDKHGLDILWNLCFILMMFSGLYMLVLNSFEVKKQIKSRKQQSFI